MKRVNGIVDLKGGYIGEEATEKDTYAYMEHLLDNLILMLDHQHEVIHQDGSVVEIKAKGATA